MSLKSDLTIDASKFDRANIDKETSDFNAKLIKIWADGPRWYEVGAAEYRKLRWEGNNLLPYVRRMADFALQAKRPCQSLPSYQRESTARYHHVMRAAQYRTACSSPRMEKVRGFICIYTVADGCCRVRLSKYSQL